MWNGVTSRFGTFCGNIRLTQEQLDDGSTKSKGVVSTLNRAYWGHNDQLANCLWVGSWGKTTQARPPRDIDLFFKLPLADYQRVMGLTGNKQSQLLQEVKNFLQLTYPQTDIRGDGQVVMVLFNSLLVEVLPCFERTDGTYLICDTHNGGSWTVADPIAEMQAIQNGDTDSNGNLRNLIRMLKIWKRECNVPMKSYILETLAKNFIAQWPYRTSDLFWYDWMVRDAFRYLVSMADCWLVVPDGNMVALGHDWLSRTETAKGRAILACEYERLDLITHAGEEWQKIFGAWIGKYA